MALPSRLFCDTSFFYACLDPDDTNHERAQELTADAVASATTFVTTWDIVSETVTLLRYRLGFRPAMRFLDEIKPDLLIIDYSREVRDQAQQIFRRRARAHRLSFCDAISYVAVTTLLDQMPCFAFDRDFRTLGLTVIS